MKNNFQQEITLVIIEKLLIGVIILCAGLWINKELENFKNVSTFKKGINEKRVEKISEVWELVYVYQESAMSYYENNIKEWDKQNMYSRTKQEWEIAPALMKDSTGKVIVVSEGDKGSFTETNYFKIVIPDSPVLDSIYLNLQEKLIPSKFWLGEPNYNHIQNYISSIHSLREYDSGKGQEWVDSIKNKIELSKVTINKIRNQLLEEE